jgi:hypothetical protein
MESVIFCTITQCSLIEVLSTLLATCFIPVSLAYYSTLKMEATMSSAIWSTFNTLYGCMFQMIELFSTTAVRTSNST